MQTNGAPRILIKEMGPRDGLQNESVTISTEQKCQFIDALAETGLRYIECGAFVSPRWVPQMADSDAVFATLTRRPGVTYAALAPNDKGLDRALAAGVDEIAVFAAASETFSQKNINCSIAESLSRFAPMIKRASAARVPIRGYLSCVLGCPYEGDVEPERVAELSAELMEMGCYEVSLGDTIGIGTPISAARLYETVLQRVPSEHTALHFHDTYCRALANLWVCIERGARVIDSAVSGLGGCPYAAGASGNVATENVVDLLHRSGFDTGIDLTALLKVGDLVSQWLHKSSRTPVSMAYGRS
ncbi:MAG: hydroxymethylglutaryl-CoA lyase, partial [Gammaproteobacteria bacterium]